jgi:hypothetical protein
MGARNLVLKNITRIAGQLTKVRYSQTRQLTHITKTNDTIFQG